jgi:hypothetical protein
MSPPQDSEEADCFPSFDGAAGDEGESWGTGKDPRAVESWLGMDAKRRGALGMQRFDST